MKSRISRCLIAFSVFIAPALGRAHGQSSMSDEGPNHRFQVTRTTFSDGDTLPLSAVYSQCSFYPGGAETGLLSCRGPMLRATRSVSSWSRTT